MKKKSKTHKNEEKREKYLNTYSQRDEEGLKIENGRKKGFENVKWKLRRVEEQNVNGNGRKGRKMR